MCPLCISAATAHGAGCVCPICRGRAASSAAVRSRPPTRAADGAGLQAGVSQPAAPIAPAATLAADYGHSTSIDAAPPPRHSGGGHRDARAGAGEPPRHRRALAALTASVARDDDPVAAEGGAPMHVDSDGAEDDAELAHRVADSVPRSPAARPPPPPPATGAACCVPGHPDLCSGNCGGACARAASVAQAPLAAPPQLDADSLAAAAYQLRKLDEAARRTSSSDESDDEEWDPAAVAAAYSEYAAQAAGGGWRPSAAAWMCVALREVDAMDDSESPHGTAARRALRYAVDALTERRVKPQPGVAQPRGPAPLPGAASLRSVPSTRVADGVRTKRVPAATLSADYGRNTGASPRSTPATDVVVPAGQPRGERFRSGGRDYFLAPRSGALVCCDGPPPRPCNRAGCGVWHWSCDHALCRAPTGARPRGGGAAPAPAAAAPFRGAPPPAAAAAPAQAPLRSAQ